MQSRMIGLASVGAVVAIGLAWLVMPGGGVPAPEPVRAGEVARVDPPEPEPVSAPEVAVPRPLPRAAEAVRAPEAVQGWQAAPRGSDQDLAELKEIEDAEAQGDAWWTEERLAGVARRAVSQRIDRTADEFRRGVEAASSKVRDRVEGITQRTLARMEAIEVEVEAGADPTEAYSRLHQARRDALREIEGVVGAGAGSQQIMDAMGITPESEAQDLGWGIPLDDAGWEALFQQ